MINGKVALYQRILAIAHMTNRNTNKNGVKLLATMMVLAVAITGICITSSDSDANSSDYFSGAVTTGDDGTIIIDGKTTIPSSFNLTDNVSVKNGGNLTIPKGVVVSGDGTISIEEGAKLTVAGETGDSITIDNNGLIIIVSEEAKIKGTVSGSGTIDTSAAQSEGTISGKWNTTTTYTENQKITISADTTLVSGTQIVILGTLVIPDNVTLTIAKGAQLVIYGTFAKLENSGNIVVESDAGAPYVAGSAWAQPSISELRAAGAFIVNGSEIINNGTITLDFEETDEATRANWQMVVDSKRFMNNGEIIVGEDSAIFIGSTIENSKDASIDIYGTIMTKSQAETEIQDLENSGSITLNGYIRQGIVKISNTDASAVVIIESVTAVQGNAEIDVVNGILPGKRTYVDGTSASIVLKIGRGYVFGEVTIGTGTEKDLFDSSKYIKTLSISGEASVDWADETNTEEISGVVANIEVIPLANGKVIVSEDLTLAANVDIHVFGTAVFAITGTLESIEKIKNDGVITVEGKITSRKQIDNRDEATLNAAYYKVAKTTTSGDDTHIYTTLAEATGSGSSKVNVYGDIAVVSDLTIPATTSVALEADSKITIRDSAMISVDQSSCINFTSGSEITVEGTLYLADKKTGVKGTTTISSEVISEGEKDRTYTNLSNALSGASEGSTVILNDNVLVEDSLIIPEGVKVDSNEKSITVAPGASITVDGTLFLNSGNLELDYSDESVAELTLNGSIVSTDNNVRNFGIQCAYYQVTDESATTYYYIEPIETAVENITKADDFTIEILVISKVKDLSISGTTDETATIKVSEDFSAGTITLDNASIKFTANKTIEAKFTNGIGTVALKGIAGTDLNVNSTTDGSAKTLTVSGNIEESESEDPVMVISDSVTVEKIGVAGKVDVEGTLTVSGISNTITLISNHGTVNVNNKATITVRIFENLGEINVAEKDTNGNATGTLQMETLTMGITAADVTTGATATISGNAEAKYIVVSSGTTIPANMIEGMDHTEYYIEDSLWITFFVSLAVPINDITSAPIENAYFDGGWLKEDRKTPVPTTTKVGTPGFEKVYADVRYDIYNVTIIGDAGIGSVAIDGVVLKTVDNEFKAEKLVAGNHKVTYVLKNGYEGEAVLYLNGEAVINNTISLSGSDVNENGVIEMKYTLSGTTPVSAVTPTPVITPASGDDMGLTEYLLIVLVILAAILVVVVAIRMMRS